MDMKVEVIFIKLDYVIYGVFIFVCVCVGEVLFEMIFIVVLLEFMEDFVLFVFFFRKFKVQNF